MLKRVPPLPKSPHDTCTEGWPEGMRGGVKGEDPARVPRDSGVKEGQLDSSNGPPEANGQVEEYPHGGLQVGMGLFVGVHKGKCL